MINTASGPGQPEGELFAAPNSQDVLRKLQSPDGATAKPAQQPEAAAPDAGPDDQFRAGLRARADKFIADQARSEAAYDVDQAEQSAQWYKDHGVTRPETSAEWEDRQKAVQTGYEARAQAAHAQVLQSADAVAPLDPVAAEQHAGAAAQISAEAQAHRQELQDARKLREEANRPEEEVDLSAARATAVEHARGLQEARERRDAATEQAKGWLTRWVDRHQKGLHRFHGLIKPVGVGGGGVLMAALSATQPGDTSIGLTGLAMALGGSAIAAYLGNEEYQSKRRDVFRARS